MTITQLEYVLAVAEFQHFGKAAASCHVTQPTLSMQLQKLEEELQITIFDRSKSPIGVTDEGKIVIEQAKRIVSEHQKLYSILNESKDEIVGEFRLSVIPTLSPFIIPLFVGDFSKRYPKVKLIIQESITEDIMRDLDDGLIDAGILVTPLNNKNIIEKVIYYEPFYLFTSREHELYQKETVREEDLNIEEIWLLNKGNCFRDQVLNICARVKESELTSNVEFESGNFETLKNLVLNGNGYTILPHMAVTQISKEHQDMVKQFAAPTPMREVSLVSSKDNVKHKILNALEEELLAAVPDDIRQISDKDKAIIDIT